MVDVTSDPGTGDTTPIFFDGDEYFSLVTDKETGEQVKKIPGWLKAQYPTDDKKVKRRKGKHILVEQYPIPTGKNAYALMSWAADGRGCNWAGVRKEDPNMPCPNGKKGLAGGWVYEVTYGLGVPMERQGNRRFQ
jgi:hypothetical protein